MEKIVSYIEFFREAFGDLGIYPDMLHILDLAIFCDNYASAFLVWTDDSSIFPGRSRDERLLGLYRRYLTWCIENRLWDLQVNKLFRFDKNFCVLYCMPLGKLRQHLRNPKWFKGTTNSISDPDTSGENYGIPIDRTKEIKWSIVQNDDSLCFPYSV